MMSGQQMLVSVSGHHFWFQRKPGANGPVSRNMFHDADKFPLNGSLNMKGRFTFWLHVTVAKGVVQPFTDQETTIS